MYISKDLAHVFIYLDVVEDIDSWRQFICTTYRSTFTHEKNNEIGYKKRGNESRQSEYEAKRCGL